jgi:hypothetical protein
MTYSAKVAVCSEIIPKHSTQGKHHVEFLNVKTWWYVKIPLGFARLSETLVCLTLRGGFISGVE